jgi:hypothetical protein
LEEDCLAGVTGSQWITEQVDASKMFLGMRDNSLALDMNDHPHIAYGGDHLYYAFHDGVVWHIETVDWGDDVGVYASLELDVAGRPHIAYYDRGLNQLKYAYHDGLSWQVQVADPHDGMS